MAGNRADGRLRTREQLDHELPILRDAALGAAQRNDRVDLARIGREVEALRAEFAVLAESEPCRADHASLAERHRYVVPTLTEGEIEAEMVEMAQDPLYRAVAAALAEEFESSDAELAIQPLTPAKLPDRPRKPA